MENMSGEQETGVSGDSISFEGKEVKEVMSVLFEVVLSNPMRCNAIQPNPGEDKQEDTVKIQCNATKMLDDEAEL